MLAIVSLYLSTLTAMGQQRHEPLVQVLGEIFERNAFHTTHCRGAVLYLATVEFRPGTTIDENVARAWGVDRSTMPLVLNLAKNIAKTSGNVRIEYAALSFNTPNIALYDGEKRPKHESFISVGELDKLRKAGNRKDSHKLLTTALGVPTTSSEILVMKTSMSESEMFFRKEDMQSFTADDIIARLYAKHSIVVDIMLLVRSQDGKPAIVTDRYQVDDGYWRLLPNAKLSEK